MLNFIESINWRFILIHIPATILLVLGVRQFSYLLDIEIVKSIINYGSDEFFKHIQNTDQSLGERLHYLSKYISIYVTIGF